MKKINLLFSFLVLFLAASSSWAQIQVANIGFKGFRYYIAIERVHENNEEFLKFWLQDTKSERRSEISSCTYSFKALSSQIENSDDLSEDIELRWMLYRSGYSSTSIDKFFPTLQKLLQRTRSDCIVKPLQKLIDELEPKLG